MQITTISGIKHSVNILPEREHPMPYTLNGFGTRYYGRRDVAEDGSYVTTLWATALYVPLLPLGSYRVLPYGKGTNWVVHSSQSYVTQPVSLCWEQIWHVYMVGIPILFLLGGLIWASEKDDRERKSFEDQMDTMGTSLTTARGGADRVQDECWRVLKSSENSGQTRRSSLQDDLHEHCAPAIAPTDAYLQKIGDMQRLIERGLAMRALKDADRTSLHTYQGVWRIRRHQEEETKQVLVCLADLTNECVGAVDSVFATMEKEDKDACGMLAAINEKCD